MSKSKLVLALAGFVLAFAIAIPIQAAPPSDGCANPFNLVAVNSAVDRTTARIVDKAGNHDKLVCERTEGQGTQYVDNQ